MKIKKSDQNILTWIKTWLRNYTIILSTSCFSNEVYICFSECNCTCDRPSSRIRVLWWFRHVWQLWNVEILPASTKPDDDVNKRHVQTIYGIIIRTIKINEQKKLHKGLRYYNGSSEVNQANSRLVKLFSYHWWGWKIIFCIQPNLIIS